MLTLNDGAVLHGFMPARYPLQKEMSESQLLGQETVWRDLSETGVIGIGRKTWTSSAGDFDLFELSECGFGEQAIHDIDDSVAELDQ
jgi:type VI secretion system protein ImpE